MKLQENLKSFHDLGAEVWVISNDPADKLEKMRGKLGLELPTLMDPDLSVAADYGIRRDKGDLPHPATLVIDPKGKVTYLRVDEGIVERPEPEEVLEAVKKGGAAG